MTTALDMALELAERAERDPVVGVKSAGKIISLLRRTKQELLTRANPLGEPRFAHAFGLAERVLERFTEESVRPLAALGVTHIVRPDDAARPLTQAEPIVGPLRIEWPGGDGLVRSLFAGTLDGDPQNLSRVSVRIAINGSDELFTTGSAPAYVPLVAFQPGNHAWFRLRDYPVTSAQRWTVHFNYEGAPFGPPSVSPFLLFGFARKN